MSIVRMSARACALLAASCPLAALLSGCDGPAHAPPVLPVTVTTQDAAGSSTRGQDVTFTYTVTNTSGETLSDLSAIPRDSTDPISGEEPFLARSITCSAQGTTCPTTTATSIGTMTLPPHAALVFTITETVNIDFDGQALQMLEVFSPSHSGSPMGTAHVTLADARDGGYEIFAPDGRLANVAVHFTPGAMTFQVSTESAPISFTLDPGSYVFSDGSRMIARPDLLVGSHDFGAGREPFIAARNMVDTLAELDGARFTLFTADTPAGGAAATAVHAAWISGATLGVCKDAAPRSADTCPTGSQWLYALTQSGVVFTGVDNVHGDTMVFQVAKSGDSRYLLRAEQSGAVGRFAIGVPSVAASGAPRFLGSVGGSWSAVRLGGGYASWAYQDINTVEPTVLAALQDVAGGPPGLQQSQWVVGGNAATVLAAYDASLAVQLVGPSELDLLAYLYD